MAPRCARESSSASSSSPTAATAATSEARGATSARCVGTRPVKVAAPKSTAVGSATAARQIAAADAICAAARTLCGPDASCITTARTLPSSCTGHATARTLSAPVKATRAPRAKIAASGAVAGQAAALLAQLLSRLG
jgi:hypothetical protein